MEHSIVALPPKTLAPYFISACIILHCLWSQPEFIFNDIIIEQSGLEYCNAFLQSCIVVTRLMP